MRIFFWTLIASRFARSSLRAGRLWRPARRLLLAQIAAAGGKETIGHYNTLPGASNTDELRVLRWTYTRIIQVCI